MTRPPPRSPLFPPPPPSRPPVEAAPAAVIVTGPASRPVTVFAATPAAAVAAPVPLTEPVPPVCAKLMLSALSTPVCWVLQTSERRHASSPVDLLHPHYMELPVIAYVA